MRLWQKYLVCPSKSRAYLSVWEVVFFPVPEEFVCCFFQYSFWYILAYVSRLGEDGLVVYDYLFSYQRESQSVPDRNIFAIRLLILSHLELWRKELPKLTSSILMGIVTIPVVVIDQFYFYMHQPIKIWLFEKILCWASLSLHFHMVLKSLAPY